MKLSTSFQIMCIFEISGVRYAGVKKMYVSSPRNAFRIWEKIIRPETIKIRGQTIDIFYKGMPAV